MKLTRILAVFLAAGWTTATGQSPITTIDGVYLERQVLGDSVSWLNPEKEPITSGDVIVFDVPGIGEYLGEDEASLDDIVLTIESLELPEFAAYMEDTESSLVKFKFSDALLTAAHRQQLYNMEEIAQKVFKVGIRVGEDIDLVYSGKVKFFFKKVEQWRGMRWFFLGAFVIGFFVFVAWFPTMLKSDMEGLPAVDGKAAYSFGKTQLAFWTLIIIACFIYIWSFTGDLNSMNTTALVLLGISSATITATTLIGDREKRDAAKADKKDEKQSDKKKALAEYRSTTGNFFKDILSDHGGVSIHRFQAFVLNLLFGVAFIKTVLADYAMPDFNETQLILLGLSNGTYAFLKGSENRDQ
jgi:hypothetical protein